MAVAADAQRVRQVLVNLVGNAVKFTSVGRVDVRAKWVKRSDDDVVVRFVVKDTGPGIPQKSIPELFNRFSQLDGSYERRFAGSGLGLAISKSIVVAMDGQIGGDSVHGEGPLFGLNCRSPSAGHSLQPSALRIPKPTGPGGLNVLGGRRYGAEQRLTSTVLRRAGRSEIVEPRAAPKPFCWCRQMFDAFSWTSRCPG